ncbi:hypothetical protein, partial [Brucella tritici]|uniref:hypothetical protein n=1 Tax=Brucella tritici TaxID=94626 RepID=UPI003D6C8797
MALCLEQDGSLYKEPDASVSVFGLLKDFLEKFGLVVDSFGLWGLYGATTRAATLLAADRFVP